MLKGSIKIINPLGLHARAAAQLVRLSDRFESKIIIMRQGNNAFADAKSILSILTLAAPIGTTLTINIEGPDEKEAFEAIQEIFKAGFGEI